MGDQPPVADVGGEEMGAAVPVQAVSVETIAAEPGYDLIALDIGAEPPPVDADQLPGDLVEPLAEVALRVRRLRERLGRIAFAAVFDGGDALLDVLEVHRDGPQGPSRGVAEGRHLVGDVPQIPGQAPLE